MSMDFRVVIPARYASSRLPGKPLADIGGVPMVVRVARQAERSGAREVVVATDDARVGDAVAAAGHAVRMTRPDHASGSDRVMEVAEACGWPDDAVVVNVQGDEPLVPPAAIVQVAELLLGDPGTGVATLCEPIADAERLFDPNVVKVVIGGDGFARYFSRAPIPWARDAFGAAAARSGTLPADGVWYRHIGLYAYRVAALRRFVALPSGRLERLEALEQLRLLEHGIDIRVAVTRQPVPGGVDTAADLERVREAIAGG
ncbi:MAG TPA: 3-deoxy-manno-octulosonate cytidylyltransferase [Pseudomonadales bacterium]